MLISERSETSFHFFGEKIPRPEALVEIEAAPESWISVLVLGREGTRCVMAGVWSASASSVFFVRLEFELRGGGRGTENDVCFRCFGLQGGG